MLSLDLAIFCFYFSLSRTMGTCKVTLPGWRRLMWSKLEWDWLIEATNKQPPTMNDMDRHVQQTNDRLHCIKQVSFSWWLCLNMLRRAEIMLQKVSTNFHNSSIVTDTSCERDGLVSEPRNNLQFEFSCSNTRTDQVLIILESLCSFRKEKAGSKFMSLSVVLVLSFHPSFKILREVSFWKVFLQKERRKLVFL